MPKVQIVTPDKAILAPVREAGVRTSAFFDAENQSLHMSLHELAPEAILTIAAQPVDCVAYVWRGAADVGSVRLEARSSAIVERGESMKMRASKDGAVILTFNAGHLAAAPRPGGHVHLLPNARVPRTDNMDGEGKTGGALHADANCPTCQVWLHENDFMEGGRELALHSHSEDEIIFVRAGQMRLGGRLYDPGMAVAIAANTKYSFKTGPEGLSFVNFRASSPTYSQADGSLVLDEAALWRSAVGVPQYLAPEAAR